MRDLAPTSSHNSTIRGLHHRPRGPGDPVVAADHGETTQWQAPASEPVSSQASGSAAARSLFSLFEGSRFGSRRPSVSSNSGTQSHAPSQPMQSSPVRRPPSLIDSLYGYGGLDSMIPAGREHVGKFLSPQDAKALGTDMSNVAKAAEKYRQALEVMSGAAADLGAALDQCSRAKGAHGAESGRFDNDAQVAGGLHLLISNHAHLLGTSIQDNFQEPVLKHLKEYRTKVQERESQFKAALRAKIQALRTAQTQSERDARKRRRNLLEYRTQLLDLTSQIDDINRLKLEFLSDMQVLASTLSENTHLALSSLVTAEIEIFESIAHKGWSGGGLEDLMSMCPDPFDGSLSVNKQSSNSGNNTELRESSPVIAPLNGSSADSPRRVSVSDEYEENSSPPLFSVLPSRSILPGDAEEGDLTISSSHEEPPLDNAESPA